MPHTQVRAYKDESGAVPIREWLAELRRRDRKAFAKCMVRLLELRCEGFEMRRPHADFLRDGIYELRAKVSRVHYRVLYFFQGKNAVVLSHGIVKQDVVPANEIGTAVARKAQVEMNSDKYTAEFQIEE